MVNEKGFDKKGLAKSKSVGAQGAGGPKGSGEVYAVGGATAKISPKKMGSGMGPLSQGPIEPKVGK